MSRGRPKGAKDKQPRKPRVVKLAIIEKHVPVLEEVVVEKPVAIE